MRDKVKKIKPTSQGSKSYLTGENLRGGDLRRKGDGDLRLGGERLRLQRTIKKRVRELLLPFIITKSSAHSNISAAVSLRESILR